jgi:hypothetical protein
MTVQELIEKLQTLEQSKTITFSGECGYSEIDIKLYPKEYLANWQDDFYYIDAK